METNYRELSRLDYYMVVNGLHLMTCYSMLNDMSEEDRIKSIEEIKVNARKSLRYTVDDIISTVEDKVYSSDLHENIRVREYVKTKSGRLKPKRKRSKLSRPMHLLNLMDESIRYFNSIQDN